MERSPSFVRNPDLVSTDMDGDTVMMSVERGNYYGIGGVGSRIWELLENPISIDDIVRRICFEFEVDEEVCHDDVSRFVEELMANELVMSAGT